METYYDEALGDNGGKPKHKGTRRDYYWICAIEQTTGTPIVDGPFDTEEEGDRVGYEKLRGEYFEVRAMKTIDRNRATAEWRHERLMRSGKLIEVLKRTKHKI